MTNHFAISGPGWCFALINGRLAEIYFHKVGGIFLHRYLKRKKFNKWEKKMMAIDLQKYQFTYRNDCYINKKHGIRQRRSKID